MSDVLFRYLLMARDRDRSWWHRAFRSDERLLAAGLVKLEETAAVRVQIAEQRERVSRIEAPFVPASESEKVTFFDQPEPQPPVAGTLEDRIERFPLRSTLRVEPCSRCLGGYLVCKACRGRRRCRCFACNGFGRVIFLVLRCQDCEGTGEISCLACGGTGRIVDATCRGQGQVATWQEHVFEYSVRRISRTFVPEGAPPELRDGVESAIDRLGEPLSEFTPDAAVQQLGYATPELDHVLKRALRAPGEVQTASHMKTERSLHFVPTARIVPVASCRVLSEKMQNPAGYWLLGRGDEALEIRPPYAPRQWTATAYTALALGVGAIAAAVSIVAPQPWFTVATVVALTAGVAIGLMRPQSRVLIIAVLPCSGERSVYLSCLASVGSHAGGLDVLDHTYRADLQSLLGDAQPATQSQSLAVRTSDGDCVRLIEVAQPERLSRDEWARMAKAVDGIIYLCESGWSEELLRSKLERSVSPAPAQVILRLDTHETESDRSGAGPSGDLALDVIRRAFTRRSGTPLDWPSVFGRLWEPVTALLTRTAVEERSPDQVRGTPPLRASGAPTEPRVS